jgi:hypothetical protein
MKLGKLNLLASRQGTLFRKAVANAAGRVGTVPFLARRDLLDGE